MASKTISVSLEAYERLRAARCRERESFSRVICRAEWPTKGGTAADLLATCAGVEGKTMVDLAALDAAQEHDAPPSDPWEE